jgi:MFS transporter, DHA2 family, methylenomycin A resistance protein
LFVLNLYFQQVLKYSALLAGLALLPQMGMASVGSLLSGRFTGRAGSPRPAMLTGLLLGAAGLLALLIADAHTPYLQLIVPLVAVGFGMAFTMPAATTAVLEGVSRERAGLASGAINAARQLGSVIGVALLGSLIAGHHRFLAGQRIALTIAGSAFLLAVIITALAVDRPAPVHL